MCSDDEILLGAHNNRDEMFDTLKKVLIENIDSLMNLRTEEGSL